MTKLWSFGSAKVPSLGGPKRLGLLSGVGCPFPAAVSAVSVVPVPGLPPAGVVPPLFTGSLFPGAVVAVAPVSELVPEDELF